MRVAVISDIHANLIALEAVLKDIEQENCEHIICLGDLVLAGPQPKETLVFVRQQNWTIIQGNTDKLIVDYGQDIIGMLKENYPVMANALVDDINYITEDDKKFLEELAPMISADIDGVKILFVHGSPRANNENILPGRPLDEIEEIIADTEADLILCGHTHIPCGYQTNKKQTVVNVGSVGRPMTPSPLACYVVVDSENGIFNVRHKFVDYDREKASELVRARNFEGADQLAELLINPVNRHI